MQVFVGGGNAIFLLLTVLFTGFLALVALFAWRTRNRSIFRTATGVGVILHEPTLLALSASKSRQPTSFLRDVENLFPRVRLASR